MKDSTASAGSRIRTVAALAAFSAFAAAFTLFNQCRNVLALKGERKDSHDAYKVAARLAVLSYLIGKAYHTFHRGGADRIAK